MHHAFKLGDTEHNVELSRSRGGYRLHLGGQVHEIRHDGDAIVVDGVAAPVASATHGDDVYIHVDGAAYQLRYEHPLDRLAHQVHGAAEDSVRAPMPGSLVAISVKPGDKVAKGQSLLVMESMKMETTLSAARDGVVAAIHFEPGQTFDRDALLVSLEPDRLSSGPSPAAGRGE